LLFPQTDNRFILTPLGQQTTIKVRLLGGRNKQLTCYGWLCFSPCLWHARKRITEAIVYQ